MRVKQSRHPLTLAELRELVKREHVVIWTEAKCGSALVPKIIAGIKMVKGWGEMICFTDGDDMWLESYNKTWRAWLMFHPKPEECEVNAWGGDGDA